MGYACTVNADETLQKIYDICFEQTFSETTYIIDKKAYLIEVGQENEDGSITGSIYKLSSIDIANSTIVGKSAFKIAANGSILYGVGLKKLLKMDEEKAEEL